MATPDQIKDDLTLDIDAPELTPEQFATGVKAFFDMVKSVGAAMKHKKHVRWFVNVYEGSALVGLRARPGCAPADVEAVSRMVAAGIDTLEAGGPLPSQFSEEAIRNLRKLGTIVGRNGQDTARVRVWVKREPQVVTRKSVAHADDLLGWNYQDYGSVEGQLSVISERGGYRFVIYERLWDKPVKCYVGEELLEQALRNFGKRIEVYGDVQYRKDGAPVNVRVEDIVEFPPRDTLPDFRDLRGILRAGNGC